MASKKKKVLSPISPHIFLPRHAQQKVIWVFEHRYIRMYLGGELGQGKSEQSGGKISFNSGLFTCPISEHDFEISQSIYEYKYILFVLLTCKLNVILDLCGLKGLCASAMFSPWGWLMLFTIQDEVLSKIPRSIIFVMELSILDTYGVK